ncbi:MAG: hypothetical protein U0411_09490 [Thermodesulfovibrionales bacterium]
MNSLTPYWCEEGGIAILADGYLGFVFRYDDMLKEPSGRDIQSFQVIHSAALEEPIAAVRTNIRVAYRGSLIKTFLSSSYASETMQATGRKAMEKAMGIKEELCGGSRLLSAKEVASKVAAKKYFLYVSASSGDIGALIHKVDFSFSWSGKGAACIVNTDHLAPAMSLCHDLRFWTVALPLRIFDCQIRFLSLPLGAIPSLLSEMRLFLRSFRHA